MFKRNLADKAALLQADNEIGAVASLKATAAGHRMFAVVIVAAIAAVTIADRLTQDNLHIGILYNICIAMTLWSWRPRWVIAVTAASDLLRLGAYALEPNVTAEETPHVANFNLVVGLAVQTLTGALIWRHMRVQRRLEQEQEQTRQHALSLIQALKDAQAATATAMDAVQKERTARQHEADARSREHHAFQALARVQDLSAALNRAVLPTIPPEIGGDRLRLSARYAPAERDIQIGGDFYDLIALDDADTQYALVIGDVAGHGVEAAAQTALVTTTLRACTFDAADGPAGVITRAARALEGQLESFVSLFYGVYDADAATVTYTCAGHEPPILISSNGIITPLAPTGPIIGVGLSGYKQATAGLQTGDTLIFLTDGLTEVRNGAAMLGWQGIAEIAARQSLKSTDVECVADGILQEARAWSGTNGLTDDVALVIARVVSAPLTQ